MFLKEMAKRKLTEVTAQSAREICVGMGFAPTSYSYMLQSLVRNGFMKKTGTTQKSKYLLKSEK